MAARTKVSFIVLQGLRALVGAPVAILLVVMLLAFPAAAQLEFYVAVDGSDSNDGLSRDRPVATLQRAHDVLAERLTTQAGPAIVHIGSGTYRDQTVRWGFSMRDHTITIQGDPRQRPVFDGKGMAKAKSGHAEFLNITRDARPDGGPSNIEVRGLQIQNYFEAIWIRGYRSRDPAYEWSEGRNLIEDVRFVDIGRAFAVAGEGSDRSARGAILIRGSRDNVIRNNTFSNITNDAAFPRNYATYGGLHAIYVIDFSNGTVIEKNTFSRIFTRGVIKFRNYSNFGRVIGNHFDDDTTLLIDAYCDLSAPVCQRAPTYECPSWGIEFSHNTYRHFRGPQMVRPTFDIQHNSANENYCNSEQFRLRTKLDRQALANNVKGSQRLVSEGNTQVAK